MDAKKTQDLVHLAALSLLCATVAWVADRYIFGTIFTAFSAAAVLGAALTTRRR
jgi:hypothetical protein